MRHFLKVIFVMIVIIGAVFVSRAQENSVKLLNQTCNQSVPLNSSDFCYESRILE